MKKPAAASLPEFLSIVEEAQKATGHSHWYRGCGRNNHDLTPALYRHPKIKKVADLLAMERDLMLRFRQRGVPFHAKDLSNNWEALFFMQHYGVPTRLLDWTENPFIGLYFALEEAVRIQQQSRKRQPVADAAVWLLDAEGWNRSALSHISYDGGPLSVGDGPLNGYEPSVASTGMGKFPVALLGTHNSARIVAQRGVFVIFGDGLDPLEVLVGKAPFSGEELVKVTIPKDRIEGMWKSLLTHGISESVVYPDLEGLARETKREFGFKSTGP